MTTHSSLLIQVLKNQRGTALLESIPLLVIFVMLISLGLGMFGAVHTAVLNSIAARTYAFETFRQRTNLTYFREDLSGITRPTKVDYSKKGWRYHAVQHESDTRNTFVATVRPMSLGSAMAQSSVSEDDNNSGIYGMTDRNQQYGVNPLWVMVGYGICLNSQCGN